MRFILASQSPRRKELLSFYGFPFEVIPSGAKEEGITGSCREIVEQLACLKGRDVALSNPDAVIIASDTLVCIGEEILGKPTDEADARRMLKRLSGAYHQVHTGLYLRCPDGREISGVDTATVHFRPMPDAFIDAYIASGDPMDKAGAYAIQGQTGIFIDSVQGNPFTVMGLPIAMLTAFFEEAGIPYYPD